MAVANEDPLPGDTIGSADGQRKRGAYAEFRIMPSSIGDCRI